MAVIEISDSIAEALRAQAKVRNLSLEAFLEHIAEPLTPLRPIPEQVWADVEKAMDELPPAAVALPSSFSRADVYDDPPQ